jgi:phosphate-selective porin OprO and OprP
MIGQRAPLRLTVAAAMLIAASLSARDVRAQSNEELMRIIREQQRQIEELSRKVDALIGQTEAATERADQAGEQAAAVETAQQVEEQAPDLKVEWAPGPTLSSKDGSWSMHVRGRLFVDGGALGDEDDLYKDDNGVELRAARLGIEGTFYDGWNYIFETDFGLGDVEVKDAYIEYDGDLVDPAYVRVGQYKTPNSLEELTSSRFLTFMERSAIVDAFALDRQIGLGTGASGENWGVDVGVFGQNAADVNDNEGYALAGRGHYAFFLDPQDRGAGSSELVHLGASARYRNFDNDTFGSEVTYEQRPFFHFTGTRSVDTGAIPDSEGDVWAGAEFAWVNGPFSLQSEVANTALQRKSGEEDANNLWGGYIDASYFLTGEHRNYDPESGAFDRVEVNSPLHEGGPGAWEVAARADYIDLNDEGVKGGEQISYIGGVNWYMNDYVRLMLDGAVTQVFNAGDTDAAVTGSENVIYGGGVRAQVDW